MNKRFFKSVEVKIAAFALMGLFLLVWGINFLKGIDLFKKSYQMYVVFEQSLGLTPANSVVINGVAIGTIDRIELMHSAGNKVIMRLGIDKKIAIPRNSTLTIGSSGFLGSPYVEVIFGNETTHYQAGDTIYGVIIPGLMSAMGNLTANLENTITSLDTSIQILKQTLQSGAVADFEVTLAKLRETVEVFADNKNKINYIFSDINSFTTTLKNNDAKINDIVENLNNLSKQLADSDIKKAIDEVSQTFAHLDTILLAASEGQGTVGQLLVNDSLYYNLQNSLQSLDRLLIDLQKNPSKYVNVTVFGRKEKK
jgi:phospholipid/cholesterol/gamma-HCH transport system substrate-binding protein